MTDTHNKPKRHYGERTWMAAAALIGVLTAVSFIPPFEVCGVTVRRANILSDVVQFNDSAPRVEDYDRFVTEPAPEELNLDFDSIAAEIAAAMPVESETGPDDEADPDERAGMPAPIPVSFDWRAGEAPHPQFAERFTREPAAEYTPIEDFDTTGQSPMVRALMRLAAGQPVRIAVMGDSFVEGDILTCDLRNMLQSAFGASDDGIGFAPMASPLTGFRRTVKTRSTGWTSYNVMQQKRTPELLADKYMSGGWVCSPADGASTRWEPTDYGKAAMNYASHADIYFLSPEQSRVEVTLNDSLSRGFDVEGSPLLRRVSITAAEIASVTFRVAGSCTGFVGYGASFSGSGVALDNYSVRSNSGQALLRMNHSLNAQSDRFAPCDIVVLQYGLNIMQQGRFNYESYTEQLEKYTELMRSCFPSAAVLVMGVSDRSVKADNGRFVPMDSAEAMTAAQREAARRTGAAFWDTREAMLRSGGMTRFVADGCAGKDYTHINYGGGARVARALFEAIYAAAWEYRDCRPKADGDIDAVLTAEFATEIDSLMAAPRRQPETLPR